MAWKPKKKHKPLSYNEQQFVKKLIEDAKKKSFKPIKGEVACVSNVSGQQYVQTARYFTEDDLQKDAEDIVNKLNGVGNGKKKWKLVSAKVLGKDVSQDNGEESNEE